MASAQMLLACVPAVPLQPPGLNQSLMPIYIQHSKTGALTAIGELTSDLAARPLSPPLNQTETLQQATTFCDNAVDCWSRVRFGEYCFPSSATVQKLVGQDTIATRMDEVHVGDRVLTAAGFSKVFAFLDHTSAVEVEYLRFGTESGRELLLTKEHSVYVHADRQPVLAMEVRRGDLLWVARSHPSGAVGIATAPLEPSRVVAVTAERAKGAHAPITEEGSLLVDGVLASSYAGVQSLRWGETTLMTGHRVNMLVHAPLRFVCEIAPSACGPAWHDAELGRHVWTQWVIDRFGWLHELNLEHSDLRAACCSLSPTAWAAACAQVLAALTLLVLDSAVFSFAPGQLVAVLLLLWARRRHNGRKAATEMAR